ncbi:MAG: acetyl-CoA hydrolase/transferase family protein [Candidatus Binatia bacterium]
MEIVSADEAIARIPRGATVVFAAGCVEPRSLHRAFAAAADGFRDLRVISGLSFGAYGFLERGLGENFRYFTWQSSPKLRAQTRAGLVGLLPIRYGDVHRVIRRSGVIEPDVLVTQVSPPRRGRVSLGISSGVQRDLIAEVKLVIAEVNPQMPWTSGASTIPMERVDFAVESDEPLLEYRTPKASERDAKILDHVLSLVPEDATVQLGVGSVPDRVLSRLAGVRGVRLFSGMFSQALLDFLQATDGGPPVVTGELAGDATLYRFADRNPRIRMAPASVTHDVGRVAKLPRFTSINSTIEIDLMGQANGETIDGVQVSGVGGSLDFLEAAAASDGGLSILALPSTTEDGTRSRIVKRLGEGAVVTAPRFCVDAVVTEHGIARLRGKDLAARAEALTAIAHPDFRGSLTS